MDTIVKVSVFCLSSLRNEVKKLFYVHFYKFDSFFLFHFNIAKMHIFCSFFFKDYCCFRQKKLLLATNSKKLVHLRFWSDGADCRTEGQKFFNARTMHTN